jgi:hypothetical protein
MGKELIVLLPDTLLHLLALLGDRPMLAVFVGSGLQVVVSQLVLLLLLLLMLLWELRLPGIARAQLLVLMRVGTNMRLVVGPVVVLMELLVMARARLLLYGLLDTQP